MSHDDIYFLKIAIEEGKKGQRYPFGGVVVVDDKVIAKDHNHAWEYNDPTAHAETLALVKACKKLGNHNLPPGSVLYSSHEPCLMCFTCASWARIERLVFAIPASEIRGDMFEFKGVNIFQVAKKLQRPMKVEHIRLT
jgi:tRNA(Arg) A34 adenosine deaminase TadA